MFYSSDFGGDKKYETYRANAFAYAPLGRQFVLGGRADARATRGDVTFYQLLRRNRAHWGTSKVFDDVDSASAWGGGIRRRPVDIRR
jgi:hypothetical protein